MSVGKEIEQIRKELEIPIYRMCDILNVTERDYDDIVRGHYKPSTVQLVRFIDATHRPLKSIS